MDDVLGRRNIGAVHHQMDVFLRKRGNDRDPGRLRAFDTCPSQGER